METHASGYMSDILSRRSPFGSRLWRVEVFKSLFDKEPSEKKCIAAPTVGEVIKRMGIQPAMMDWEPCLSSGKELGSYVYFPVYTGTKMERYYFIWLT